ncbi:hypothetical protein H7U08_30845 [Bacillus cereus]|uniref:Uncharacterized protein n=1 Tax=Bacillus cereus TaxID=1396 RepID=A0AAW4R1J8_BACCE|nr:hypothetical protein [Bacillus cereus]MBY0040884.1 hypothetical protein [Bacillus cereus]
MNKKIIFFIMTVLYINVYSLYNYMVSNSFASDFVNKLNISFIIIIGIGLAFNLFTLVVLVNLNWLATSLGITYIKGSSISEYTEISKSDYYITYFVYYTIHFIIITMILALNITNNLETFQFILKVSNIIAIILISITLGLYMFKRKALNKISTSGLVIINVGNLIYATYFM